MEISEGYSETTPASSLGDDVPNSHHESPLVGASRIAPTSVQKPLLRNQEEHSDIVDEDDDDGEEEEAWSATMTANIYSLIYASKPNGAAFWFALFLFGFQASLMILAL